ncbi:hypothetical protein [Lysobacter sp. H23M47]|uniref:hypothetical protein n=1 Tax=Lysobacter sp. H23M47 TaxID=2781024 RepID=UPI00187FCB57|nr:hypothetical protein [Lysobacter sp. H23M47]QOW24836.1 hypothetical protein INQ43_01790 [Lysobacter sp. H23M47]
MTDKRASQEAPLELHTKEQQADRTDVPSPSPTDQMVSGMIRTLEEIQRDPLLHHRLSQRGF